MGDEQSPPPKCLLSYLCVVIGLKLTASAPLPVNTEVSPRAAWHPFSPGGYFCQGKSLSVFHGLVPVAQQPPLLLRVESDEQNPVLEQSADERRAPGPVGSSLDTLLKSLLMLIRPVLITHLTTFVDWGCGASENGHNSWEGLGE